MTEDITYEIEALSKDGVILEVWETCAYAEDPDEARKTMASLVKQNPGEKLRLVKILQSREVIE